jgi:uncharacterized DUF497 family protein
VRYEFDWDPLKAAANTSKHGVTFQEAMLVFQDPLALSLYDEDHSETEDRWITLGRCGPTRLLLVIHTHVEITEDRIAIRIISARRPTRHETRQYEDGLTR